jgi:hypothetical protein
LARLLEDATAGDPSTGLLWTHRSLRKLAKALGRHGIRLAPNTMISVDTKKKEWIGLFKNPGRTWRRDAREVLAHDFPSLAVGRAIPYGIYDVAHNDGLVVVGPRMRRPPLPARASAAGGFSSDGSVIRRPSAC